MTSGLSVVSTSSAFVSRGLTPLHVRAQIEQNYGEQLLKLSQVMLGQGEEGTLGQCIAHVPSAMETTGRAHVDLSNRLRQHLGAPLLAFLKDQTEKSKAQYQQIENSRHLKQIHRENVARVNNHRYIEGKGGS